MSFPRGTFSSIVTSLKPGTPYYIRSYGTSSGSGNQTGYGNQSTFTTLAGPPTVTSYPTVASGGSATFQALLETGGDPVILRGFCWDIRPGPTMDLPTKVEEAGSFSNGIFSLVGSGFDNETSYYVRSYAVNSYGTSYSNEYVLTSGYYYFSTHTFTNAGALTRTGPTLGMCQQEYETRGANWVTNGDLFTMNNLGQQIWRVPTTGNYAIDAYGAQGGASFGGTAGGLGARIRGTFYLDQGTWATIVVGQQGGQGILTSIAAGGGGGGSFVWTDTTQPLVTAGGGGGSRTGTAGGSGQTTTDGQAAPNGGGSGGTSGGAGGGVSCGGAGGGGWLTGSASYSCSGNEQTPVGGQTRSTGFFGGGMGNLNGAQGGFGGGGGCTYGGGGGGGYSGGGGGNNQGSGGGGGGSYNAGLNQTITEGVETGQGQVQIQWLPSPLLSTLGVSSIGQYQAFSGGHLLYIPGTFAGLQGLVWDTTSNPTVQLATKTFQTGTYSTGSYLLSISSLFAGTPYYVRPYSYTNQSTLGYGGSLLFSTLNGPPHVITASAGLITAGSSDVTGNVVATGGTSITLRGIVWGTVSSPTIELSTQTAESGTFGTGTFTGTATSLATSSTYYARAYAVNTDGLSYGDPLLLLTELYTYTTFTFTPASATQRNGPTLSQCRAAYSFDAWTQNSAYFNMTVQGFQRWTVPRTATYEIDVYGAKGGSQNGDVWVGGNGARIRISVSLTIGMIVNIVVGQQGQAGINSSVAGGGGGGGSFVWIDGQTTPLAVAGGGGGGWSSTGSYASGQSGTSGGTPSSGGVGGTNGQGGTGGGGCSGAGGGGWLSNAVGVYGCVGNEVQPVGGQGLPGNFIGGGIGHTYGAAGGFGGGGGTVHGGAGGGGYSGGGGGANSAAAGGGGGSFGTYISTHSSNEGYVIITNLDILIVRTVSASVLFGGSSTVTGSILGAGTSPIVRRGVCWSTVPDPTILLPTKTVESGVFSTGTFTANITNVSDNVIYVRAYATNSEETVYGQNILVRNVISPSALWLDAQDATTITTSGGRVTQWRDKSGNDRHATQAPEATNGVTFINNSMRLSGNASAFAVTLDFLAGQNFSAFVVMKNSNFVNIFGALNGGQNQNSLHVGFNNSSQYKVNFWGNDYYATISAAYRSGQTNMINYDWRGEGKAVRANATLEGSTTQTGVIGTMAGGGRIGNVVGQGYLQADINEMIFILNENITPSIRSQYEGYLAWKWGIQAYLPSGHPYKNSAP